MKKKELVLVARYVFFDLRCGGTQQLERLAPLARRMEKKEKKILN
jgi:hypothetical protein